MKVSMGVTLEISDDLEAQELRQELRTLREDIEMCMGSEGFPILSVYVSPALEESQALRRQSIFTYIFEETMSKWIEDWEEDIQESWDEWMEESYRTRKQMDREERNRLAHKEFRRELRKNKIKR